MRSTTISEQKAALRREIRAQIKLLTAEQLRPGDEVLAARFLALDQVRRAKTIMLYYAMGTEPDTPRLIRPLLDRNKRVLLPRCLPGNGMEARAITGTAQLVRHKHGMMEPGLDCPVVDSGEIDLILVPGMAFDRQCRRLGHGGGFYDRFLEDYCGPTVALCRDCFLMDEIPCEPHDRPVDCVVAECGVFTRET